MRGSGWCALGGRAVGCALVLGVGAAPALAQNSVDLARARQTLEYYQACERTHRFAPCWDLLSGGVRAEWARQGRGTVEDYAAARSADERRFSDFRVLQVRRSPARVVFVVEARGGAEGGAASERVEYALLREGGQWKVDGRRVGPSETTP